MKWVLAAISIVVIVLLGMAAANYFYQQEFVDFLNGLGWGKLAGFASGSWWVNIPTWVLAIGVLSGMWFTWRQIGQARESTNAQIAVELFGQLRSEETLKILRYIYGLAPNEDGKYLSIVHKNEIDHVLNKFNMLGALVAQGIVDRQLTIEAFGGYAALRCWYKLHKYIREEQCRRGWYQENYEVFARFSLDYFEKAEIPVKLDKVDLVKVLRENLSLRPRTLKEIKKGR